MPNQKTLTAANIRYLIVMSQLNETGNGVRCKDIAATLGITKPSVHNMMCALSDIGLIDKGPYGAAKLTELGNKTAALYNRYYSLVYKLLSDNLPELGNKQLAVCNLLSEMDINIDDADSVY